MSNQTRTENEDTETCLECGDSMTRINSQHLRKHKLSLAAYRNKIALGDYDLPKEEREKSKKKKQTPKKEENEVVDLSQEPVKKKGIISKLMNKNDPDKDPHGIDVISSPQTAKKPKSKIVTGKETYTVKNKKYKIVSNLPKTEDSINHKFIQDMYVMASVRTDVGEGEEAGSVPDERICNKCKESVGGIFVFFPITDEEAINKLVLEAKDVYHSDCVPYSVARPHIGQLYKPAIV